MSDQIIEGNLHVTERIQAGAISTNNGGIFVNGASTVEGNLTVQHGELSVTNVHVHQNLQVSGAEYVHGGLQVSGTLSVDNIGIGTAHPVSQLHISGGKWNLSSSEGDLKIGNDQYRLKFGVALAGNGAGDSYIRAHGGTNQLILNEVLSIRGPNVGIGTRSPRARLDVEGKIRSHNAATQVTASNRIGTWETNWVDMPNMITSVNVSQNPVFILFRTGGVQPSTPYNTARLFYRLLIDDEVKTYSMNEFHNSGWELRDITLTWLEILPEGRHTIKVQWKTENRAYQNNACWGDNTRSLTVIEL